MARGTELVERARLLKEEGNRLHQREEFEGAARHYQAALDGIPHELLSELYFMKDKAQYETLVRVKKECKLNLSLVLIKLKRHQEAILEATDVSSQQHHMRIGDTAAGPEIGEGLPQTCDGPERARKPRRRLQGYLEGPRLLIYMQE